MKVFMITLIFLCLNCGLLMASEDTLTVFAYPPSKPLDWTTPKTALRSFIKITIQQKLFRGEKIESLDETNQSSTINEFYRSTMGHTITHVKCTTSQGEKYDTWTSFSGQDYLEVDNRLLFEDKVGLGALFYDYFDGHIINGEENIKRLVYYRGGGSPRYLQVPVDANNCDQLKEMVEFYKGFQHKKFMPLRELEALPDEQKLYFTTNLDPYESYMARKSDPKAKVGGGCAPYGIALLKVINKYDRDLDSLLKLKLEISENQFGDKQRNPIHLKELLFGEKGSHWKFPGFSTRKMNQYDPSLIWAFIGGIQKCIETQGNECEGKYAQWYASNASRLESGQKISLENTLKVKIQEQNVYGEYEYKDVLKTRKVDLEGIILN